MEDQNYQLITAYFEKTIDDDGLTQLQEWIEAHPVNLEQFIETIRILEASRLYLGQTQKQAAVWSRIDAHIRETEQPILKRKIRIGWMSRAAILLILCAVGFLGYHQFSDTTQTIDYAEIRNPDGQHSRISLPDGSAVFLGGGSRIKYQKAFSGKKRTVYLDGEAFFEVRHQAERPFAVSSGEITTVVLGTSFNVKAFSLEKKVAVTVKTGRVGVMSMAGGKSQLIRYLTPDEHIEINTHTGLYTFNAANASEESAWIKNDFIFYDTPLNEIVTSLEHRYGVKIEFTDPELGKIRLTAKFKNIPIQQVVGQLEILSGLAFTQKGKLIFISGNHQKGGRIMR